MAPPRLPETEYPLVYQRFLGEDGLSGIGLSLYTALPVSIAGGTHEVWLQGTTQASEPLYGDGTRSPRSCGCRILAAVPEHLHPRSASRGPAAIPTTPISAAGSWAWIFA